MLKHVTWNTLTTGLRTGLSLLRYLLIARYLSPRDFGLFALAKGVIDAISLFKVLGSNQALIVADADAVQRGSADACLRSHDWLAIYCIYRRISRHR